MWYSKPGEEGDLEHQSCVQPAVCSAIVGPTLWIPMKAIERYGPKSSGILDGGSCCAVDARPRTRHVWGIFSWLPTD